MWMLILFLEPWADAGIYGKVQNIFIFIQEEGGNAGCGPCRWADGHLEAGDEPTGELTMSDDESDRCHRPEWDN